MWDSGQAGRRSAAIMIGTTLGPYRITGSLGSGETGKVYRATTTRQAAGP